MDAIPLAESDKGKDADGYRAEFIGLVKSMNNKFRLVFIVKGQPKRQFFL